MWLQKREMSAVRSPDVRLNMKVFKFVFNRNINSKGKSSWRNKFDNIRRLGHAGGSKDRVFVVLLFRACSTKFSHLIASGISRASSSFRGRT